MDLGSILVTCANDSRYLDRLDLAFEIADRHGKHVTVIHAVPTPEDVPSPPRAASSAYIEARLETAREEDELLKRQTFERAKARDRELRWISGAGSLQETVAREAVLADVTIVGRSETSSFEDWIRDHLVDFLAKTVDTPVLYAPPVGDYRMPGNSVMVAWDGSSPAMRAVRAALPLLRRMEVVHVVSLDPKSAEPLQVGRAMVDYLDQHNIGAQLHGNECGETAIGAALLEMARRLKAEAIVMGAHSKPKLHEILFGSVTRTLLTETTTPILLAG